ncbi:MAG: toxin TcdB middle/N-terminal domain-containing protein, partial [Spirochaetota bacterium]
MKKLAFWLLLCSLFFTACSRESSKEEAVNTPVLPVRIYGDGITATDAEGNPVNQEVYNAFDNRIETAWHPATTTIISIPCGAQYVDTLRLYGINDVSIRIYSDSKKRNILSTIDNTTTHDSGWIDIPVQSTLNECVIEVTPCGTQPAIAHIELWGHTETTMGVYTHLEGADSNQVEACENLQAVDVYLAKSNEAGDSFEVSIPNPWQYRRMYVVFEAQIFRPVNALLKVNECDWLGGLSIPEAAGNSVMRQHSVQVCVQWFVPGKNTLYFKGNGQELSPKNVRVVAVKDTGYNEVRAGTDALVDGMTESTVTIGAAGAIVTVKQPVRMYGVLLYLQGGNVKVNVKDGAGFIEAGSIAASKAGWYYVTCNHAYVTDAVQIVTGDEKQCTVGEVIVCGSPAGERKPEIVISYPRNGEYFGRTAYIEGFVTPYATKEGVATLTIGGRQIPTGISGGFTTAISKDMVGLQHQDDATPWKLECVVQYTAIAPQGLQRLYDDSAAAHSTTATLVLDTGYSPYTQSTGDTTTTNDTSTTTDVPQGTGLTITVQPSSAKSIYYQGVQIEIPKGAVDEAVSITIIPLGEKDVAPLTPGMRNVTAPAAGYRFLFNGKAHGSFKKAITISIPYDSSRLLSGTNEQQIQMYYYDDVSGIWKRMEGSRVVTKKEADFALYARSAVSSTGTGGLVVAQSTHFTDFINATLSVPEHPEALMFNPNSIKDIKAGDPVAGMQLIQPPQVSNTGDAGVRFPITIPKGRAGMQPQLELTYSQQGGSGPFGLGWNMRISSISIDTKWGAARYDGTDVYVLDGSQLVPVDNNGNYRTRIEGGFARIVKQGNQWIVTHKNGVQYIYGETDTARLSSGGKIAQWFLEWMIDPNGNCVHYTYAKVTGTLPGSSTPYVQVYLDTIYYTGYNKTNGPFSVQFIREGGRPDVQIDGRMGFIVYTAQRYKEIVVGYNGETIWRYMLQYTTGAFDKSLLAKVEVRAGNGELFYAHDFEYYDEIGWGNEHLNLFGEVVEMDRSANISEKVYDTNVFHYGSIGGSKSSTNQFQFSGNVAPGNPEKMFSVGAEYSVSKTDTKTKILLMDIDGDGLADQVYSDGGLKYRRNLMGEGINGFAAEKDVRGLPSLGDDENISKTKGVGLNAGMAGARFQTGNSKSETLSYFADVNGDGLVDFIEDRKVYYNYGYNEADGTVQFSTAIPQGSQPVTNEINAPVSPVDEGEEAESKYSFLEYYFRDDPVLVWRAPFDGKITINGNVIVQKSVPENYTTADGVKVSIQKTGTINSALPKYEDVARGSSKQISLDNVEVKSGEYILFRVDCNRDGAYDEVQWNPVITYKGYVPEAVDENNMYIYKYNVAEDFYVYGSGVFDTPVTGVVKINAGKICKYAKTSDDIMVKIIKKRITQTIDCSNNAQTQTDIQTLWEYTLPISAEFVGTVDIPDRVDEDVENRESRIVGDNNTVQSITMNKTIFECTLQSDTPIDYRKVKWENDDGYMGPLLQYTDVDPGTGDNQMSEDNIKKLKERIFVIPVVTSLYTKPLTYIGNEVQNPLNPYVFEGWNVPRKGKYRITITATNEKDTPYMENLVLSIKKRRQGLGYVADVLGKVVNDTHTGLQAGETLVLQQELDLDEADDLYYIITAATTEGLQFNLKVEYDLFSNNPWVSGDEMWMEIPGVEYIVYTTIDPAQDISFAGGFRNWYYGRYNADSFMYGQNAPNTYNYEVETINTDLLKVDIDEAKNNPQKFAEKIAICSSMIPKYKEKVDTQLEEELERVNSKTTNPSYPVWRGMDDDCWIGPGVFAATRVAKKNIEDLLNNPDIADEGESVLQGMGTLRAGTTSAVDMRGVSKITKTNNFTGNFSGIGSSITITTSTGRTKRQFFDINGDRYPDIITDNELIYTDIKGGYVGRTSAIKGPVQIFVSTNYNFSICPQSAAKQIETIAKGDGTITKIMSSFPSVSYLFGTGDNDIILDYQDINGDGLPDRIQGNGNNGYSVQYNTGYSLSQECTLENFNGIQHTKNKSKSLSVGYSNDKSFLSGGVSVLENSSEKMDIPIINEGDRYTLIDINGDGLPDKIVEYNDGLKIYVNTGNRFVLYNKKSIGKMEETYGISWTPSLTLGVKFTILPLITIATIIIDGGGSVTKDANSTQYTLRDINGDGLPDIVYDSEGTLKARLNRTGKTNMLKAIKNSIGGKIELDYKRVGNTRAMPQSQWVLSSVTVDDGTTNLDPTPESEHCYTTQYQYEGGVQDRKNREFLGFAKVVEQKADGSTVEKEYMVDDYYTKGLMKKQVIKDAEGRVYVEKEYTYGVRTILPATTLWLYEIKYPYLITEKTTYREGGGTGVVHTQRYAYDDWGNVTMYKDEGSPDTQSDDVIASISYNYNTASYILDRPLQIAVVDYTGKVYRNRAGTYDSKGNLTRLRIMGGQQGYAVWDFAYDQYGNIVVVKEPANYAGQSYYIQYTYDSTGIYIEKTTDAYGYTAVARYNPAFGTPYFTRDINGYSFQYHYDVFGRLKYVWGPYDMASGRAAIEVVYAGAIVTAEGLSSPAKAVTYNRSGAGYNEVIAVIRFSDGIGRELQVKTQGQVEGGYGFICSGAKVYDREGRVIAEGKPYFEQGENFDYTPVSLLYPTKYEYDCMGRKIKTTYP